MFQGIDLIMEPDIKTYQRTDDALKAVVRDYNNGDI